MPCPPCLQRRPKRLDSFHQGGTTRELGRGISPLHRDASKSLLYQGFPMD
jgi:hypothetical protein